MDIVIRRGNTVINNTNKIGVENSTPKITRTIKSTELANEIVLKPLRKKVRKNNNNQSSNNTKPRTKMNIDAEKVQLSTAYGIMTESSEINSKIVLKNPRAKHDVEDHSDDIIIKNETSSEDNNTIQRGIVRTSGDEKAETVEEDKPVVEEKAIEIPQPTKSKRSLHFKKISYNPTYKTLTLNGETGAERYVVELGANPEVIQEICDGSDYMKNVIEMKSNTITTLQKNNTDLNTEVENLRAKLETIEKTEKDNTELDEARKRISDLENKILELKEQLNNKEVSTPIADKTDDEFDASEYLPYCLMDATVTTLGSFDADIVDERADLKLITLNNGDGDYLCDQDGNIIAIARINGVLVDKYDQLQPVVEEETN